MNYINSMSILFMPFFEFEHEHVQLMLIHNLDDSLPAFAIYVVIY